MHHHIKFNSFGIPYILEFENVSVVPPRSPSSSNSSFCYIDTPPPSPRPPIFSLKTPTSIFKRKDRPTPDPVPDLKPLPPPPLNVSETNAIYIQFPPQHSCSQLSRKKRLVHLQKAISTAVLDAGMSRSPANTVHPKNHSNDEAALHKPDQKTTDALFCGTYGQMMAALQAAGLSATPCVGDALSVGYTRLGALFVARNVGTNGVQLRNITLWG